MKIILYQSTIYLDDWINRQMMVEQVAAQPYARYDHLRHLSSVKVRNSFQMLKNVKLVRIVKSIFLRPLCSTKAALCCIYISSFLGFLDLFHFEL